MGRWLFRLREQVFAFKTGWWEVPLFMALLFLLVSWISPADPFGVAEGFPWPWLMVILLALRYGFVGALFASLLLLGGWLIWTHNQTPAVPFPQDYFVGGFFAAMLCGEFSDMWQTRLRRMEDARGYIDARLGRLTREYYLLRMSHERLEQEFISRPVTLRDAIQRIRDLARLATQSGELPGAAELMNLLAQHCQLEVASLYPVRDGETPEMPAAATLGEAAELSLNDPLVQHALSRRVLSHIQSDDVDEELPLRYIIAAPVMNSEKRLLGFLTVERMPFFALQEDVLQMLLVLLEYYADSISASSLLANVKRNVDQMPDDFCAELVRLAQMNYQHGVESRLTALAFPERAETGDILQQLRRQRRGLDMVWETRLEGRWMYVTLMPLSNELAAEGYFDRVEQIVRERVGQDFASYGVQAESVDLDTPDPAQRVQEMLRHCVHRA